MNSILRDIGSFGAALLICAGLAIAGTTSVEAANNVTCNGCVDQADIAANAVTSTKIKNKTIKPADLHKSAKPAGADFSQTTTDIPLNPQKTSIVVRSVKVKAPGPGTIIGTGSGTAAFGPGDGELSCSVTTEVAIGTNPVHVYEASPYMPFSRTTAFSVDSAGNLTVNLVCYANSGEIEIYNPNLVAWFVPGKY